MNEKRDVGHGTLALMALETMGALHGYYELTRAGRKHVRQETREWERTAAIVVRFFEPGEELS